MNIRKPPEDLARDLARKQQGLYRVAAVVTDLAGRIFAWGWNYPIHIRANGVITVHAEIHALRRGNPRRFLGATITVYGEKRSGKILLARPCEKCVPVIQKRGIRRMVFSCPEVSIGWREEIIKG